MTETRENSIMITSQAHGHDYLGSTKENSQFLGYIGSDRPNLIVQPSV